MTPRPTRQQEGDEAENRCEHGVWAADRCYTCSPHKGNNSLPTPEETTLPAMDELKPECPKCKGSGKSTSFGFSSAGHMDSGSAPAMIERTCDVCRGSGRLYLPAEELTEKLLAVLRERDALKAELRQTDSLFAIAEKTVEELTEKLFRYESQSDAVVGQETPQQAWDRLRLLAIDACKSADSICGYGVEIDIPPYTPPLKAGTE